MSQDRPPFLPREKTPAALAAYEISQYYWVHSQQLAANETLLVKVSGPSQEQLTVITVQPLTESLLMVETADRDNRRHVLFMPCAPLEFTFEVVKQGTTGTRPLGFQITPPTTP